MTAVEMRLGFVLSVFESLFMLFLPFRAHAIEAFRQDVAAMLDRIAEITELAAGKPAQDGSALSQAAQAFAALVCLGLDERAFIAVVANVTVISELEAGIGGIVLVVACKGF